jgi:hypothetical protein
MKTILQDRDWVEADEDFYGFFKSSGNEIKKPNANGNTLFQFRAEKCETFLLVREKKEGSLKTRNRSTIHLLLFLNSKAKEALPTNPSLLIRITLSNQKTALK